MTFLVMNEILFYQFQVDFLRRRKCVGSCSFSRVY